MTFSADDLSSWEFCGRLPKLLHERQPERLPIREAAKRHFLSALRSTNPVDAELAFLDAASEPGFEYPAGEPYTIARDYGSWLSAALELANDIAIPGARPLPEYRLGKHIVTVQGWMDDGDVIHLFRLPSDFGERSTKTRWPELVVQALVAHPWPPPQTILVHSLRLPRVSQGRLSSPLAVGYSHPTIPGNIRLARINAQGHIERKNFSPKWKKVARWELPEIGWAEWRSGIEADQCMESCFQTHEVTILEGDERQAVRDDMEWILESMERQHQPRKREACSECMFWNWCHGSTEERSGYVAVS